MNEREGGEGRVWGEKGKATAASIEDELRWKRRREESEKRLQNRAGREG